MKLVLAFLVLTLQFGLVSCSIKKMIKAPQRSAKRISAAAESSSSELTDSEEYYIGRAVAARIVSTYPVLENEELTEYVNLVGKTVSANSNRPDIISGYHFGILDTPVLNAFACPGGVVFITIGLLKSLEDEDELAAVLAHEIAHINNKDGISSIEAKRSSGLFAVVMLEPFRFAASLVPGHLSAFSGAFIKSVDSVVDTVSVGGYDKEQELKADEDAIIYLERTAYNPYALYEYQSRLLKNNSIEIEQQGTHPGLSERIEKLKSISPTVEIQDNIIQERKARFEKAINI